MKFDQLLKDALTPLVAACLAAFVAVALGFLVPEVLAVIGAIIVVGWLLTKFGKKISVPFLVLFAAAALAVYWMINQWADNE